MLVVKKSDKAKNRPQKRYSIPKGYDVEFGIIDDPLDYIVPCPKCDKRTMDASGLPDRPIWVRHKCPHCNKIVAIPLIAAKNKRGMKAANNESDANDKN